MINNNRKSVSMKVNPKFYDRIEKQRREFMKKNNLDRLSTVAFTGLININYDKKNKLNKTKKKR